LKTIAPNNNNNKIQIHQYLRDKHSAKFHPDLIWNDGASDFFWRRSHQREQEQQ